MTEREVQAVKQVVERLQRRYCDLPPDRVNEVVAACYASLSDKPLRDFIPVLVENSARSLLRAECDELPA